ncbi:WhiB family transcriptional regulator [Kitasatospora sp. NPDC085879]|uniref:WhiB family transcriptional regulator n=1 Tax=Kitasatospora sp. NPDC085879 TaxID=3154769 RepID=UPI003414066D
MATAARGESGRAQARHGTETSSCTALGHPRPHDERCAVQGAEERTVTAESLRDLVLTYPADRIPCLTRGGELWFSRLAADQRRAAAWCQSCPVARSCRAAGRVLRTPYGVWGGELPRDRRRAGYLDHKE